MKFEGNDYEIWDDDEELDLSSYVLPPEADMSQYGMVLQILGPGGEIEEILFDIEDIYKYVKDVYKKCPKRN
jgi:hypothetical protein